MLHSDSCNKVLHVYLCDCVCFRECVCVLWDKGCQRIQPCKENLIKSLYRHEGHSAPSLSPALLSFNHSEHFSWLLDSRVYPLASKEKLYRAKDIKWFSDTGCDGDTNTGEKRQKGANISVYVSVAFLIKSHWKLWFQNVLNTKILFSAVFRWRIPDLGYNTLLTPS